MQGSFYMFNNIGYTDNDLTWQLTLNKNYTRQDYKTLFSKKRIDNEIEELGDYGNKSITMAKALHHLKLDIVEVTNA